LVVRTPPIDAGVVTIVEIAQIMRLITKEWISGCPN
jgi:hypothetical protein